MSDLRMRNVPGPPPPLPGDAPPGAPGGIGGGVGLAPGGPQGLPPPQLGQGGPPLQVGGVVQPGGPGHVVPPNRPPLDNVALMTRGDMLDRMGRPPKDDIGLSAAPLWRMSTRYKDTLKALDAFHGAQASGSSAKAMVDLLDRVETANARFLKAHPNSPAGVALQYQIGAMKTTLANTWVQQTLAAVDHYNAALDVPVGADAAARSTQRAQFGALLDDAHQAAGQLLERNPGMKSAVALQAQIERTRAAVAVLDQPGIDWTAVNGGRGMTAQQAVALAQYGMTPGPETKFEPGHDDAHVTAIVGKFGQGVVNAVARATYADGEVRILKAESATRGPASIEQSMGIPEDNPRYAARNLATKVADEVMQTNLLGTTALVMHDGKLHIAMGLATGMQGRGKTFETPLSRNDPAHAQKFEQIDGMRGAKFNDPTEWAATLEGMRVVEHPIDRDNSNYAVTEHRPYLDLDFKDPALLQAFNKLEWLDHVTGQGDRHGGNYLIDQHADLSFRSLSPIDHDGSFGPAWHDMDMVKNGKGPVFPESSYMGAGLPDVIDAGLQATLLDPTTRTQLQARLTGLVTPSELTAAMARFDQAVTTVSDPNFLVVQDWANHGYVGNDLLADHLTGPDRPGYAARDFDQQSRAENFTV